MSLTIPQLASLVIIIGTVLQSCVLSAADDHILDSTKYKKARKLWSQGIAIQKKENQETAYPILKQAWQLAEEATGIGSPKRKVFLHSLGNCCRLTKRWPEAECFFEELVEIEKKHPHATPLLNAVVHYHNLAVTYASLGKLAETRTALKAAEKIAQKVIVPGSDQEKEYLAKRLNLAQQFRRLGEELSGENDSDTANKYYELAWSITSSATESLDPKREPYLVRQMNRAIESRQWAQAEHILRQLIEIDAHQHDKTKAVGDSIHLILLAKALAHQGKTDEAEKQLEIASLFTRDHFGDESQEMVARLRHELSIRRETELGYQDMLQRLVKRCPDLNGPATPIRTLAIEAQGTIHCLREEWEQAADLLESAYTTYAQIGGKNDSALRHISELLIDAHSHMGDIASASSVMERRLNVLKDSHDLNDPTIVSCVTKLGGLYRDNQQYSDAKRISQKFLTEYESKGLRDELFLQPILVTLLHAHQAENNAKEASIVAARLERIISDNVDNPEANPDTIVRTMLVLADYRNSEAYIRASIPNIRDTLRFHSDNSDLQNYFLQRSGVSKGIIDFMSRRGLNGRGGSRACNLLRKIGYDIAIELNSFLKQHPDCVPQFEQAIFYRCIGMWESRYKNYGKATEHFLRCINICDGMDKVPGRVLSQCLTNLASVTQELGDFAQAEVILLRAVQVERAHCSGQNLGRVLVRLANLYRDLGRVADAEKYYRLSLESNETGERHDAIYGQTSHGARETLMYFGRFYCDSGRPQEAIECFKRSLKIVNTIDTPDRVRYDVLVELGKAYRQIHRYDEARQHFQRAMSITSGHFNPKEATRTVELYLGLLDLDCGSVTAAEQRFRDAAADAVATCPIFTPIWSGLASAQFKQGKPQDALDAISKGVAALEKQYGKNTSATLSLRQQAARYALLAGKLDLAWAQTQQVLSQQKSHNSPVSFNPIERSMAMDAEQQEFERMAICLAAEMGDAATAFRIWESTTANATRDLFSASGAEVQNRLPQEKRARLQAATNRVNGLHRQIRDIEEADEERPQLQRQLDAAELEYSIASTQIAEEHCRLMANDARAVISFKDASQLELLDDETAIVGWVEYERMHWACIVRTSGVEWVKLPELDAETDQVASLSKILSDQVLTRNSPASLRKALQPIYETRIAPLLPKLADVTRLIIVSQGWVTAGCPLELFPLADGSTDSTNPTPQFLADRFDISYTPSVTVLKSIQNEECTRNWPRQLLVFADPSFTDRQVTQMEQQSTPAEPFEDKSPSSLLALRSTVRFSNDVELPRLPGTRLEANRIASLFDASKTGRFLGPRASEREFFDLSNSGELQDYRYVHLATHGYLDTDRPEFSGIVLALAPTDESYDGILQMREVFQLKMRPEMVVLSACQTGQGRVVGSEGIVGLSTAFLATGTDSLVVSLWNVPDRSTAMLMTQFYENLQQGRTKTESLQAAKQWLRSLTSKQVQEFWTETPNDPAYERGTLRDRPLANTNHATYPYADPYFWAPFILIGKPQ